MKNAIFNAAILANNAAGKEKNAVFETGFL